MIFIRFEIISGVRKKMMRAVIKHCDLSSQKMLCLYKQTLMRSDDIAGTLHQLREGV